ILSFLQPSPEPTERIVKLVYHTFLQRNDSVIGNLNAFRTNFRATLRDVAVANALSVAQLIYAILGIERMHLESGDVNQKARSDKFVVLVMVPQDVANVLTKKALYAFPEFLHAVDVLLLHPPTAVRRVRRSRFEALDLFLHFEIP